MREDENTATEAYSQAFRRACAQFLLGRYLYDLPKLTLPYDPKSKRIAISEAERIAWVEKLYMECGLKPRSYSTPGRPIPPTAPQEQQAASPEILHHWSSLRGRPLKKAQPRRQQRQPRRPRHLQRHSRRHRNNQQQPLPCRSHNQHHLPSKSLNRHHRSPQAIQTIPFWSGLQCK